MGYFSGGILKVVAFVFASLAIVVALPHLSPVVFPRVSPPSPTFDCDDSTLETYRYFEKLGIESKPIVGNLDMQGEGYMESNHVWLLVNAGDREIAYDWGTPRFDRQHYEGYTISIDYLLYAVEEDLQDGGAMVSSRY